MDNARMLALIVIAIIAIAAAYSVIYLLTPQGSKYDSLAQCLSERDAVMYGAEGCHACEYQKGLLGASMKYISVIDCVQQYQVCMNQRIAATPTWLINGTFYTGVKTPEQLANISGCVI